MAYEIQVLNGLSNEWENAADVMRASLGLERSYPTESAAYGAASDAGITVGEEGRDGGWRVMRVEVTR